MDDDGEFEFECPSCGETLTVNESMKTALVENGCVVCGSGLTVEAFDPQ
jgi:predicted RNA-binding Zn-ribbon protein involved in translation (DUF1610 family)